MTDSQLEQAARQYAKDTEPLAAYTAGKVLTAFLAGANFALSHQWVRPEDELPEVGECILAHVPHRILPAYCEVAYWDGEDWYAQDGDFIHPSHWLPIPQLNHEKEEK